MKHIVCLLALLTFTIAAYAQEGATAQPATQPSTRPAYVDEASYGIGFNIGNQIKNSPITLTQEEFQAGMRDALDGKTPRVNEGAFRKAMDQFQKDAAVAQQTKMKEQGEKNVKDGEAYRAENGKKPGVQTTASGLQVETVKEGTGESPKATDTVKVHYTGTLVDGKKFDSSVDRGEPATFSLGGVIKGWSEGLQLMKVGGKAKLVVPPAIGYGEQGGPGGPNSTLIFDVELLEIVKPPAESAPAPAAEAPAPAPETPAPAPAPAP